MALGADGAIVAARVALGAAAMCRCALRRWKRRLSGKTANEKTFRDAAPLVLEAIDPIADFRGSAEYKRKMAIVHVRRALAEAVAHADRLS